MGGIVVLAERREGNSGITACRAADWAPRSAFVALGTFHDIDAMVRSSLPVIGRGMHLGPVRGREDGMKALGGR